MKKIVGIFLMLFSINGHCDWEPSSSSSDGLTSTYIDYKRMTKVGGNLRVWTLINLKESKQGVGSYIALDEWNCREGKRKSLQISTYSSHMGNGNPTFVTEGDGKWVYVTPNSIQEAILLKICK